MDGGLLEQAEELRARGVAANSAGRPAEAHRLLNRALRLTKQAPQTVDAQTLRARVLISTALPLLERRGMDASLEVLYEAENLLADPLGEPWRPLVFAQRAAIKLRAGYLLGALEDLNRGAEGLDRLEPRDQVVLLLNRGTLHMQALRLEQGRADLMLARQLAALYAIHDVDLMIRHNLAFLEFLAGDLPRAMSLMAAGAPGLGEFGASTVALDHARVQLEAGLLRDAQRRLRDAFAFARGSGAQHERAEIVVEMARAALLDGDQREARRLASQAKAAFRGQGSSRWADQADLVRVIVDVMSQRSPAATAQRSIVLAARFAGAGARDLEAYALLLASESSLGVHRVNEASALYHRAARAGRALSYSRRLYADLVRAKVANAQGDRAKARAIMRRASDGLARAQGRSSSLDVRAAVALHGRRLGDFALGLAVEEGSAARAFEATERWQAISNRLPAVEPPDDPELAQLTSRLRQLRDRARGVSAQRNEAIEKIAVLERRIREKDWHGPGSDSAALARPATIGATRRRLSARSADLVSYFSHAGVVHAIVVTPRTSRLVAVAEEPEIIELASRIQADLIAANQPRLHPAIASSVRASLTHRLDEVDKALLDALSLRHDRLVVVPSYAVAGLPWGMLPSRRGRPTTVARSATTWAAAGERPQTDGTSVYAVAGPGLDSADAEVDAIAAQWPAATIVHAADSTQTGLVEALRSHQVVHIAAHGEHQAQNPLFSSVRLSDGVLFAYELQHGGVTAEHVVLSACDVGRATIRPGDEALGLTASLLALGARNVVAAVAPVPDTTAHRVMGAYHKHLAAGLDVSAALAKASMVDDLGGLFCSFGADWSPPG